MHKFHHQLLDPQTYPETTGSVVFKETHISRIYLTDSHAYKLKKPLDLGFLDFTSLEKRRHFCNEEVRLNRRFAADTYLGVVELRQQAGKVRFSREGKLIDYAVKMRRLPEQYMLDHMIETEAPGLAEKMPRLGTALYTVMERAEICRSEPVRNIEVVRRNCEENFTQSSSAIGTSLTEDAHQLMQKINRNSLSELEETMIKREADGFVRDGHGDLHTANICMTEPICIYDCIEFNRRFRVADIIADLAFLIMDLEFRQRRDLADRLVNDYLWRTQDRAAKKLLPFYKQYRAWVRGKVDAMLATDPDASASTRKSATALARRYFNLALGYQLKPTLFLTSGLMGVGKTSLAKALSQATGAKLLRSDVIRKQLAGLPEKQRCLEEFGSGLYSPESSKRTYDELFRSTAEILRQKGSLIIDASFAQAKERERFIALAEQLGCPVWLVHLLCPDETALERLDQRSDDPSDGRRELFAKQRAAFCEVPQTAWVVKVDSRHPVDYNVQSLLCRVLSSQQEQLS